MKKIFFFLGFLFVLSNIHAQQFVKNLKWWGDRGLLISFDSDLQALSNSIDSLNGTLITFKIAFDDYRSNSSLISSDSFNRKCRSDTLAIADNIMRIQNKSFYTKGLLRQDSSFLYYYTNKELNDYLQSLQLIKREIKRLSKSDKLDAFSCNNFLNAYYYMSESRSLLLAAMDNLERYYSLSNVADAIADTGRVIRETSSTTKQNTDIINNTLDKVDSVTLHSDTVLSSAFIPYKPLNAKNSQRVQNGSKDKIGNAANTILIDNRRNWWWRTLIGGVVGGLVAGLIVHSLE